MTEPSTRPTSPVRTALLAVIAVGLVLLGGGLAVALGLGGGAEAPDADSVDVGFSRDMAVHHLQGVEMANLALARSDYDEVRMLAFDIAETQNNQVGRMHGWLAFWGHSPTGGDVMAWMGDGGHGGHDMDAMDGGLMPGMATEDELAGLRELSGTEFDVEFLRLMTRHHQGGLDMARYAEENGETSVVRNLARAIAASQTAETELMIGMLADRGATPLPAP